jgi:uncharacterized membrane protein YdjX (TVP38/TMEM64 family)
MFTNAKSWFQDELPYSLIVYYLIFCACAIVLIPYGPFCIAIGFIFGLGWGLVIQMFAVFISATLLFGIGRYVFKEKVKICTYRLLSMHMHLPYPNSSMKPNLPRAHALCVHEDIIFPPS